MNPRLVVILSGLFLIVLGSVLIAIQFYVQLSTPEITMPARSLDLEAVGAKANLSTTYVGLSLVVVGAFLELIGLRYEKGHHYSN